jgi:AcrR family transcriptional regulator
MPADQDPIREQLIEARRNQILEAAVGVFADKGFHRATTKEIASAAGVSEGTIYNYFENKADLLISMITRLADMEELPEELAGALEWDAQEFLAAMMRHRMARIEQNHEMLQAILPEILTNPELRQRFYQHFVQPTATILEQYVRGRIESGELRPTNPSLTVRVVQSMFAGMLMLRILGDEAIKSGWDELPDVLATLVFEGLRARDGG